MLSRDRWYPFEEMSDFHRDINRAFGWSGAPIKSGQSWLPAAEVTSGSEGWTIRMGLPGIDPKDVSVDLDHNVLTISGERTTPEGEDKKHLSELGYGRFTRSFTLPASGHGRHREGGGEVRARDAGIDASRDRGDKAKTDQNRRVDPRTPQAGVLSLPQAYAPRAGIRFRIPARLISAEAAGPQHRRYFFWSAISESSAASLAFCSSS